MRSLGASSVAKESNLEKVRLRATGPSLGVVTDLGIVLCESGPLTVSVFHLRCLFSGSLFPPDASQIWFIANTAAAGTEAIVAAQQHPCRLQFGSEP
ncbi:hypothetical protein RIF29_38039 [Crotalaria pallida]|uniref:Uncharacterized protein n=1 Tax=Crotalaria pallida TaxID=3830 RepID=A0AAN9E1H0_CROPI